jgi:hypothetical protein
VFHNDEEYFLVIFFKHIVKFEELGTEVEIGDEVLVADTDVRFDVFLSEF